MTQSALSPERARETLGRLGQRLYRAEPECIWDHDTNTLSKKLQRLRHKYRDFARAEIAPLALKADVDPSSVSIPDLFMRSAEAGFQTEFMPRPWGLMSLGSLFSAPLLPGALKAEEFCAADGGLGLALLAPALGVAPLFISGNFNAYFRMLPKIYKEIEAGIPAIAAFAITEPAAGSDVEDTEGGETASLGCFYRKVEGGYRISGRKCFISDGAVARWVTLFAAEQGQGLESWTCFLLDQSMEGLEVGRAERKMGQRAADASELVLEDVFVPEDRVVGAPRSGWAISRNVLNFSRPIVGAIGLGIARGAFEHATEFCRNHQLAGRPLTEYQDVQLALSDMLLKLSAMRAMVWHCTRYQAPSQAAGAMTKVFCADTAWDVCNAAMRLLGDHGTVHTNGVEKAARDARLTQIYEGTNQINRLAIYESQLGAEF